MTRTTLLAAALLAAACKSDRNLFAQEQVDSFRQAPNNQVDILWVVDDSNSMEQEQEILRLGFESFADQIDESGADFHLGVVTTSFEYDDPLRGVLIGEPTFLTSADDYVDQFQARVEVGTLGSDKEKGMEAALFALHPVMNVEGGPNNGFVRPDAQLLVVFVSDEEDCSDFGTLEGQPSSACYTDFDALPDVSGLVQAFRGLKDDSDLVSVGAIVGTAQSTCSEQVPGTRYSQLVRQMGGLLGDICNPDWSDVLSAFGVTASGIRTRFQLSEAAQPDTIVVNVEGDVVNESPANGWTYDAETWFLEFHGPAIPPRGSAISVEYTIQPGVPLPPADATDAL